MVKRIGGHWCAITRVGLRKCQPQELSRRCRITGCQSLKIVVGGLVLRNVPETHLHVCQVNVGEEEARQICSAQMYVLSIRSWWLFQELVSRTITKSKRKIRGRHLEWSVHLVNWEFLTQLYQRNLQMVFKSCLRWCSTRWGSLSYLDLDDEIIELYHTNRADSSIYAWSSSRSGSHLWQGS